MEFVFESIPSLPRLGWCAEVDRGENFCRVTYGLGVETRENVFIEGAWNGPFKEFRFELATTMIGTGGRVAPDGLVFSTSTDMLTPVWTLEKADRLYLSNSLVFLLSRCDEYLDLNHPDYFWDLLQVKRWGLRKGQGDIRLESKRRARIHFYCNLQVDRTLTIRRISKHFDRPPGTYREYRNLLSAGMRAVILNAQDQERNFRYEPLATTSRGYDSVAISVLAAELGVRETLTFADDRRWQDDGRAIAELLGMRVIEISKDQKQKIIDLAEAEICACPPGTGIGWAPATKHLEGRLLLGGYFGDRIIRLETQVNLPDLISPSSDGLPGQEFNEVRLRAGCLHFPVLFIAINYSRSLFDISSAEEMQPFSVGGDYDRPILRRIVEEAGIPRTAFGQKKMVGPAVWISYPEILSPAGRMDFEKFLGEKDLRAGGKPGIGDRLAAAIFLPLDRINGFFKWLRRPGLTSLFLPLILVSNRKRRHFWYPSIYRYTFHWGVDRLRRRYETESDRVARHS